MTSRSHPSWVVLLLAVGACGRTGELLPDPCVGMECRPTMTISWTASRGRSPIDILFVVDDRVPNGSASAVFGTAMSDLTANLQEALDIRRFAADIHLGLVSANLAPGGPTQLWPRSDACPLPTGPYVQLSELCDLPPSFPGALADLLACAPTHLPESGLPSRPLDTVLALLSPGGLAEQTGFRRQNAELLIGVVTSEDDPTAADPVSRKKFVDFIHSLDPSDMLFYMTAVAPDDATGLAELKEAPPYLVLEDIAAARWPRLGNIVDTHLSNIVQICIDVPDPDESLQTGQASIACTAVERVTKTSGEIFERPLSECPPDGTSTEPCWWERLDRTRCPVAGLFLQYAEPPHACRAGDPIRVTATCFPPYQPAEPLVPEKSP